MEQIAQLITMRDAALERLQLNPDYKLVTSLDRLISELKASFTPIKPAATKTASEIKTDPKPAPEISTIVHGPDANLEDQIIESLDADLTALGDTLDADVIVN